MSKEEKQGREEGIVNVLLASQQDETAALSWELTKSAEYERN